jgi:hypothetical protein
MNHVSDTRTHEIKEENHRLKGRLAKIKEEATEAGEKMLGLAGAGLYGFGYGVFSTMKGGSLSVPYVVGGKIPLDTLGALGFGILALMTPERDSAEPFLAGAAGAAIGIYTGRLGAQWETTRLANAGTPATNPTTAPQIGTAASTTTPAAQTQSSTTQGPRRRFAAY